MVARKPHAELLGRVARQVVVRRLIDEHRGDVEARRVRLAGQGVAVEEAAGDVVRMRQRPVDGGDDGDGLAALSGGRREAAVGGRRRVGAVGAADAAGQREAGRGGQELPAGAAQVSVEHGSVPGREFGGSL